MRAKHTSSTSLSVRWGRIPRLQLHGILRGYKILYRVLGDSEDVYKFRKAIPFQYQIELRGLLKFTTYGIRVVGFTIGDGKVSEEIIATTDQDRKWTESRDRILAGGADSTMVVQVALITTSRVRDRLGVVI